AGSIAAFATGQTEKPAASAAKKQLNFVFMPGVVDPFYYTMQKGAEKAAAKYGVNLIVGEYPKSWGPEQQVPILQATVARGNIDMVFLAPTSTGPALIAPLKKLYDSGIEIITVDTYLGDGDYSKQSDYSFPLSYIGSDNVAGGKLMGESLAKLIGEKGDVYINSTNPDVSSVNGRIEGFKQAVAEFPNIKLVGVDYNLDVQQKAEQQASAILQKYPHLAGIFGTNLYSAQGAYHAVVNAGLTGAVKIASWDATQDLIDALKAGHIDMTLAQKPADMGYLAVEWGYKYFTDHATVPKHIGTGFELFTKQNVDDPNMQQYIYSK
ncbi:MAG TPA: ABC transporter substrate-binding protein, partial [Spirochaetia bacterium]|nr:ABC transporter substrate-binding protein [Spirochaetia bacterium]